MMSQSPNPIRPGAFLESLIRFLMPFFIATATDTDAARSEIIETLCSYGGRTRAELTNAARIIAFSMSSLDLLAESQRADLSPSQRVRFRSCANGLNRSVIQNEKTLDKRLAADPPQPTDPRQEPINDLPETEAEATLQAALATIHTGRDRASGVRPVPPPSIHPGGRPLPMAAIIPPLPQSPVPAGQIASF